MRRLTLAERQTASEHLASLPAERLCEAVFLSAHTGTLNLPPVLRELAALYCDHVAADAAASLLRADLREDQRQVNISNRAAYAARAAALRAYPAAAGA